MINITILVITASAKHQADDPSGLHLGGEIIGVYNRIEESPSLRRRIGFGHINDVPVEDISELSFLTDSNLDNDGNIISRSKWRVDSTLLTEDELSHIVSGNQLYSDWTRFKEVCINVVTGSFLTDEDL